MPSVLVQGAKRAHSVTARRQKNRGKKQKKKEWMRACEKRFKYRPEVTRWKRRKTSNTNREQGKAKEEETKKNGAKTKASVTVAVSSGQGEAAFAMQTNIS